MDWMARYAFAMAPAHCIIFQLSWSDYVSGRGDVETMVPRVVKAAKTGEMKAYPLAGNFAELLGVKYIKGSEATVLESRKCPRIYMGVFCDDSLCLKALQHWTMLKTSELRARDIALSEVWMTRWVPGLHNIKAEGLESHLVFNCLLYTSDAADE